jgi:hypothetical protein
MDETDPGMYVYGHILLPHWMELRCFNEIKGARKLRHERLFNLPAHDRRRTIFIFKKAT